ncbi:MAG: Chromate resistance protein ChrB [Sulfurifustis sp.]
MAARSWLLLAYKVPRAPTVNRVTIWRKLRRLGAMLLNDAAWVLPATPATAEQLQWLATEIKEMGGECTLWQAELLLDEQEEELIRRFHAQVDEPYRKLLVALKRKQADIAALSRQYHLIHSQDYFRSDVGKQVFQALAEARGKQR